MEGWPSRAGPKTASRAATSGTSCRRTARSLSVTFSRYCGSSGIAARSTQSRTPPALETLAAGASARRRAAPPTTVTATCARRPAARSAAGSTSREEQNTAPRMLVISRLPHSAKGEMFKSQLLSVASITLCGDRVALCRAGDCPCSNPSGIGLLWAERKRPRGDLGRAEHPGCRRCTSRWTVTPSPAFSRGASRSSGRSSPILLQARLVRDAAPSWASA